MKVKDRILRRWFPEMEQFPSMAAAHQALMSHRRAFTTDLIAPVLFGAMSFALVLSSIYELKYERIPIGLIGMVIFAGWVLAHALAARRVIRNSLRADLLVLGVPICLKCGYDLRGQTVARCPECGCAAGALSMTESSTAGTQDTADATSEMNADGEE